VENRRGGGRGAATGKTLLERTISLTCFTKNPFIEKRRKRGERGFPVKKIWGKKKVPRETEEEKKN